MDPSPEIEQRDVSSRLRLLVPLVVTTIAILCGGYESVAGGPAARERPRGLPWIARYEALREPLADAPIAIYLNAPEARGKSRFFRAQYILTPTTLVLRWRPNRLLVGRWPQLPLVIDYRKARDLKPVLQEFRQRAAELGVDVEVRRFGKGLALIRPRDP